MHYLHGGVYVVLVVVQTFQTYVDPLAASPVLWYPWLCINQFPYHSHFLYLLKAPYFLKSRISGGPYTLGSPLFPEVLYFLKVHYSLDSLLLKSLFVEVPYFLKVP